MRNNFEQPKSEMPSLVEKDTSGRSISGLDPKFERFTTLVEGKDYTIREINKKIIVDSSPQEHFVFINPKKGDKGYLVEAPHWRTVTQEGINATLETDGGRDYFYTLNIKGVGYLKPTLQRKYTLDDYDDWNRLDEYDLEGAYGLADKEDFMNSDGSVMIKSDYFIKNGLRTEAYWTIAKLHNVIYKGRRKTIANMQKESKIPSNQKVKPEIGLRLLKTNTRIAELKEAGPDRQKVLLREAFDVFNRETKDKNLDFPELKVEIKESQEMFLNEFAKRMGENLAVLQNLGYIGWHMHSSNITLAAEIVDIGPYLPGEDYKGDPEFVSEYNGVWRGTLKDMRDISYDLKFLLRAFEEITGGYFDRNNFAMSFVSAFNRKLDVEMLRKNSTMNKGALIDMCKKIMDLSIVQNQRLKALKHGADVSDWDI